MATLKQKKVARALVKNLSVDKPKTAGEIVESSGYGVSMKKNPQVILNSEGVKGELAILGFDEKTAKEVVGHILTDESLEPQHRLKAADMVFDVHGSYAPEKTINLNVELQANPRIKALADKLNANS